MCRDAFGQIKYNIFFSSMALSLNNIALMLILMHNGSEIVVFYTFLISLFCACVIVCFLPL